MEAPAALPMLYPILIGDEFIFDFQITDNVELADATLEYWFDSEMHENITLPENHKFKITIPIDVYKLQAIVTALDTTNNLKQLRIVKWVIDNDPPKIDDLTEGEPKTSKPFFIKFTYE